MDTIEHTTHPIKLTNFRQVAGLIMILVGGGLFLDRFLKTGWLSMLLLPATGAFLYLWGVRNKRMGLILTGGIIGSIGIGALAALGPAVRLGEPGVNVFAAEPQILFSQIGTLILFMGIGWLVITLTTALATPPAALWALIPGGILVGVGSGFLLFMQGWATFLICVLLGSGLPLLVWGMLRRLFGLVIPGCLLNGGALGFYLAWVANTTPGNGLTQTGIMLASLALGWGLISLFGRWITHYYIWWPLIPGGIFAVVGLGLYIGGDPYHAMGVIGNTGGIALMIFGLYLMLMRKGIHH